MLPSTDNLGTIDGPAVFDPQRSEIIALPNQRVSFVLPTGDIAEDALFAPVIRTGLVTALTFGLGEEATETATIKGFVIHGQTYSMPKTFRAIHESGVAQAARRARQPQKVVLGSKPIAAPKILFLEKAKIRIDAHSLPEGIQKGPKLVELVRKINKATGRNLEVDQSPMGECFLEVPGEWILQNHTALADREKKKVEPMIPVLDDPIILPTVGSRICYTVDGELKKGWIIDYYIVDGGKKAEVKIADHNNRDSISYLLYSDLYAVSEKKLLNPSIVKIISPQSYSQIKDSYLAMARQLIREKLSYWAIWKVCTGKKGLRVLAATRTVNKEKPKYSWVLPEEAITMRNLNIVSFEGGEAYLNDDRRRILDITYRTKADGNLNIDLHDVDQETMTVTSLIFNAVNGRATTVRGEKRIEGFLSTENCVDLDLFSPSIFGHAQKTDRARIDVINLNWVFGFGGPSKKEGHENQTVIYWTEVSDAFRNFYIWVSMKGKHNLFDGKSVAEVRSMFADDAYPLQEMFDLMVHGYTAKNPTRDSPWTTWFLEQVMFIELADL